MKLIIDEEFSKVLTPATVAEDNILENSLLEDGYDSAFPLIIWKGKGVIVDGHRRFKLCMKHNIPFEVHEKEFKTRLDVVKWIMNRQFERRNISIRSKTYQVGKSYLIEKKAQGKVRVCEHLKDQLNSGTLERAAEFTLAVDRIVQITGIAVNDILTGKIDDPMDRIKDLAEKEPETIKRIIELAIADDITVVLATSRFEKENYERQMKAPEEKFKRR